MENHLKEYRTIKELLQLMLDNKQLFTCGLCGWNASLRDTTLDEFYLIKDYIYKNKPFTLHDFFVNDKFYWKQGDIKPRIKWLEHHISIN